ncbi:MAG: winged helix-turn-helix transcriptional regulator [Candidatus Asgardarchaeia archaeon]
MIQEANQIFSISKKDFVLVKVLIDNPSSSLEDLAKILGITKQALSKRKRKLEERRVIKSYLFWDILPKFEVTKYFEITLKKDSVVNDEIRILKELNKSWIVVMVWKNLDEMKKTISGLVLTERTQDFIELFRNLNFVVNVKITPVIIRQFLGEKIKLGDLSTKCYLKALENEIKKYSRENNVLAILYGVYSEDENIDICVIRARIPKKEFYSFEKVIAGMYFDYHIMTYKMFEERAVKEADWVATLKIGFTRDRNIERKISRILKFSQRKVFS